MALYEHVFIARPDLTTQQVETLTKEFSDIIESNGGKIAGSEYWGLRSLAYPIKKSKKAHYVMLNLDTPHAAVAECERQEGLSEDIMRFMTIKVEEHKAEASVMMRPSDRPDRGRRDHGDRSDRRKDKGAS